MECSLGALCVFARDTLSGGAAALGIFVSAVFL